MQISEFWPGEKRVRTRNNLRELNPSCWMFYTFSHGLSLQGLGFNPLISSCSFFRNFGHIGKGKETILHPSPNKASQLCAGAGLDWSVCPMQGHWNRDPDTVMSALSSFTLHQICSWCLLLLEHQVTKNMPSSKAIFT